jgi:hypothetical protein
MLLLQLAYYLARHTGSNQGRRQSAAFLPVGTCLKLREKTGKVSSFFGLEATQTHANSVNNSNPSSAQLFRSPVVLTAVSAGVCWLSGLL